MSDEPGTASHAKSDKRARALFYLYLSVSCLIVTAQVGFLLLLDRQWFCDCGVIRLWQGTLDPVQNSQQLTDPYTFLHFAFGCGLFLWLAAIRPYWHIARRAAYAIMSSALWEICENLPLVIKLFGNEGSGLHYSGDSIANSLGDTLAVVLGFAVAYRLPTPVTVSAIVALEIITFILIEDSVVAGLFRITTSTIAI